MSDQTGAAPTPRIRWGAIIWGIVFLAIALWALSIVIDPVRRDQIAELYAKTTPFTAAMWSILVIGGLMLIGGLVALVRRRQRGLAARRSALAGVEVVDDTVGNIEKPHDTLTEDVGRSE
ncbi:hypothetical protein [Microbacterium candidum]|uniref:DUF1049 domain-containing protein n=1 Tax=Microbacterium candidum TaxID=3041922 RepID=A0ABT7MX59_9MICO|nr:hypothetical protein [Microbacterium sp. ASV49]MDL9979033.1 hypothetical protein [Microbacterium sp. ASV49]